jgi:hypothetical protein
MNKLIASHHNLIQFFLKDAVRCDNFHQPCFTRALQARLGMYFEPITERAVKFFWEEIAPTARDILAKGSADICECFDDKDPSTCYFLTGDGGMGI